MALWVDGMHKGIHEWITEGRKDDKGRHSGRQAGGQGTSLSFLWPTDGARREGSGAWGKKTGADLQHLKTICQSIMDKMNIHTSFTATTSRPQWNLTPASWPASCKRHPQHRCILSSSRWSSKGASFHESFHVNNDLSGQSEARLFSQCIMK